MIEMLSQASILALLSLVVGVLPMVLGVVYAVRPSESTLGLMRPVSLAALFASLCALWSGAINILVGIANTGGPVPWTTVIVAAAETLVPMFVACGSLTIGWLCVAVGLRRTV
jgi:hypothetical protein